ncbi:MAG: signal peptidase I [Lachnospiraceae bacterium]
MKQRKNRQRKHQEIESQNREPPESKEIERKQTTLLGETLFLLRKVLVISLLLVLCGIWLFGATRNTDLGMMPAVKSGDLIFYYRLDKQYIASDLVAVKIEGRFQTRRVIAVGGDTLDLTDQGLMINGYLQQETDIVGETLPYTDGISFPITLQENQVFLLGDNRENASDSRLYGAVDVEDTLGKVVVILRRRNL